eukprot:gene3840-5075_t
MAIEALLQSEKIILDDGIYSKSKDKNTKVNKKRKFEDKNEAEEFNPKQVEKEEDRPETETLVVDGLPSQSSGGSQSKRTT